LRIYNLRDATYALPPDHSAFLTRTAAPANFAVFTQYIHLLGAVQDDIVAKK